MLPVVLPLSTTKMRYSKRQLLMVVSSFSSHMMDRLWKDIKKGVGEQGNMPITVGINGGENTRARENDEVTRPLPIVGTTKANVVLMCRCTDYIYTYTDELQHRHHDYEGASILKDRQQIDDFALDLCHQHGLTCYHDDGRPANIVEMLTMVGTVAEPKSSDGPGYLNGRRVEVQPFTVHIDGLNSPLHPEVFVFYENVKEESTGIDFRAGAVATWRKSGDDFYNRLGSARFLKDKILVPYMHHTAATRRCPTLDDVNREEMKGAGPQFELPYWNKVAGLLGSTISCIHNLLKSNGLQTDLFLITELATTVGWSSALDNYVKLLLKWNENGLPSPSQYGHNSNLGVAALIACHEEYGGLNNGRNPRCSIFANYSMTVQDIFDAQNGVTEFVINVLNPDYPKGPITFTHAVKRLDNGIKQAGTFGGTNILQVLAGLGVIPAMYGGMAILCKGTQAAKRCQIPPASFNKVLIDVANQEGMTEMEVENNNYESMVRDGKPDEPFDAEAYEEQIALRKQNKGQYKFNPDIFVWNQILPIIEKLADGIYTLVHKKRYFHSDGTYEDRSVCVEPMALSEYGPLLFRNKDQSNEPLLGREIKMMPESRLRGRPGVSKGLDGE